MDELFGYDEAGQVVAPAHDVSCCVFLFVSDKQLGDHRCSQQGKDNQRYSDPSDSHGIYEFRNQSIPPLLQIIEYCRMNIDYLRNAFIIKKTI